jgi:hypothetical protein
MNSDEEYARYRRLPSGHFDVIWNHNNEIVLSNIGLEHAARLVRELNRRKYLCHD